MTPDKQHKLAIAALLLRVGLGCVFIIGGLSKLSLLLDSHSHDTMVANYMGATGYINALFQQYIFSGNTITPSFFLTSLSVFELISGVALVAGLMVRPLALLYAFLLWSFVVSLPVMTVPGVELEIKTYTSPAIFVQIRDIALSGMMFILFNLGAGLNSIDAKYITAPKANWNYLGLTLRLSLGLMFIVSGFFGAFASVPSFASWQPLLALLGITLIFGNERLIRLGGAMTVGIMLWYFSEKFSIEKSIIGNLNGVKREFALLAAGIVLMLNGGGTFFTSSDLLQRIRATFLAYIATAKNGVNPAAISR